MYLASIGSIKEGFKVLLSEEDYILVERELVRAFTKVFNCSLISLVLYGSYARREARSDSDIDVLLVVEDELSDRMKVHKMVDEVEEILEGLYSALAKKNYHPVLSPYILTRSQARIFRPIYLDLVFDARILYDRDGFMTKVLNRVRKVLEKVGVERRRVGKGWVVVLKPKDFKFGDRIVLEV